MRTRKISTLQKIIDNQSDSIYLFSELLKLDMKFPIFLFYISKKLVYYGNSTFLEGRWQNQVRTLQKNF